MFELVELRGESVQVLIRDEDHDCFGLWMIYDGTLTEVVLPRTNELVHG